jgi:hypothetical protein
MVMMMLLFLRPVHRARERDEEAIATWRREVWPAEGVWAHLKTGPLINLAPHGLEHLVGVIKTALKQVQYRAGLIEGFLAGTGLVLEPP